MDILVLITVLGVGFALGMYITSQISEHIDSRQRYKEFKKNLENFDNREKKK
jgi:hypothetical protein